jgi:hypothetical protein
VVPRQGGDGILIGMLLPQAQQGLVATTYGRGVVQVAAGDVNGDGLADLVALDRRGMTHVSMNQGQGIFDDPFFFDAFAGDGLGSAHSVRVATGDVNGDGRAEILNFTDGAITVSAVNSAGTGANSIATIPIGPLRASDYLIELHSVVADVDGNGVGDLLAIGRNGATAVAFSEQGALFSTVTIRRR